MGGERGTRVDLLGSGRRGKLGAVNVGEGWGGYRILGCEKVVFQHSHGGGCW